jgi:uncharacterized membrane protein YhhN
MLQKHLQFSLAFAFIFILQVLMETDPITAKLVLSDFHIAVKPLITISLLIYLAYQTGLKGRFTKRIFVGLFLALIGDCLLMFVYLSDNFFTYGMIAFLSGYLAYTSAFYRDYIWAKGVERRASIIAIIIIGTLSIAFYLFLRPYLDHMKIPVMLYAVVIAVMGVMAVNRKGRVSTISFRLIFWGVVLFFVSDAFLAYNRFVNPFSYSGVVIMAAYMLAQYAITIGAIERKLRKHSVMTKTS